MRCIPTFFPLIIVIFLSACSKTEQKGNPMLTEDTIDRVISEMSLEEKALLVVGTGMGIPESLRNAFAEGNNPFAADLKSAGPEYTAMVEKIRKLVPGAAGRTAEIPRLGITAMVVADGPAGLRINP